MAKFDISTGDGDSAVNAMCPDGQVEANDAPVASPVGLGRDNNRMARAGGAPAHLRWGMPSPLVGAMVAAALCGGAHAARADVLAFVPTQTAPDPPPRTPSAPPPVLTPTWDLDGIYLWLGCDGAAGRENGAWDSTFGGDATVLRVREREPLAVVGASLGASKWTTHDGGRVWLEGLVGTEVFGHPVGASLGPIVEIDQVAGTKIGGSVGVWSFVGVAPYARVGVIEAYGAFAEIGVHIELPVYRH